MIGRLPESITINEKEYSLRCDYRNVLEVFVMFNDPELSKEEKWLEAVYLMLEDFKDPDDLEEAILNGFDINEAIKQINWFIGCGKASSGKKEKAVFHCFKEEIETKIKILWKMLKGISIFLEE